VGDEGLERFSYCSIKHEVLAQPPEQVVANTVANATLSETVALLIDRWDSMSSEEKLAVQLCIDGDKVLESIVTALP
jgi:hypothetical protein